jgi:cytoskeletal protein RodZ
MPGLGEEFRAAREARHLSLSDVSEQIHIRSVYLQSIESEDWSSIAAPVYARGFIRSYARFLGLDSDSAVERLNEMLSENATRSHEPASPKPIRTRRGAKASSPSLWLWLSLAVAVVLVLFVGYKYFNQDDGAPETAVAVASPAASAAASASASSAVSDSASSDPSAAAQTANPPEPKRAKPAPTLVVSITQRSWLLVKVDGTRKAEGIYPPGTVKEFHGKSASIRAGNGGGVHLTVNGKSMGPLGAPGSVVDKTVQLSEE